MWSTPLCISPFLSTSFIPIQLTSSWPFEARSAYTGHGPLFEGKTQRRIDAGAGSGLTTFRHRILGIWGTAWKISWTEEPGRLQSMGSRRVGHDWATSLSLYTFRHWRRKWQPTPVFLPGESQGWGSLVGCHLWGCTELDTSESTLQQQQQCGLGMRRGYRWAQPFGPPGSLPCGQECWLLEGQRRTLQSRVLKAFQTKWQGRRPWSLESKGDSLGVCKAREAWGVPKSDAVLLLAGLGLESSRYHLSGSWLIWTSGSSSHDPSYLHILLLK